MRFEAAKVQSGQSEFVRSLALEWLFPSRGVSKTRIDDVEL
jgi:hypothetical protein